MKFSWSAMDPQRPAAFLDHVAKEGTDGEGAPQNGPTGEGQGSGASAGTSAAGAAKCSGGIECRRVAEVL